MSARTGVPLGLRRLPHLAALIVTLALAPACDERPLRFSVRHIAVDHDRFDILDVAALDPDRDGDLDLLVATENDLRWLRRTASTWSNETLGTGLESLPAVERVQVDRSQDDGLSLLVERPDGRARLAYTGLGSWHEAPAGPDDAWLPDPTELRVDLDGDGRDERVRLDGRGLRIDVERHGWVDVSAEVGATALHCSRPGRRVLAGDLEGDGDLDLIVAGGHLYVLVNQGGSLTSLGRERPATAPSPPATPAELDAPALGPWFTDATLQAGLAWQHREGDEQWDIRPTMGPGAAFTDVDGDGDSDLYVAGGSEQHGALFMNEGGRFEERAEAAGLHGSRGAGMGVLFADFDNDGDSDLYVTRDGPNVLWRNDGGHFVDVTASSGTGDERWGASSAAADIDRDGDLDLFVTNYLQFDLSVLPPEPERRREDPLAMLPYVFPGQADVLYRNLSDGNGDLRFEDATESAGLLQPDGKGLGALFFDYDDDGWPDLYVANDTTPNTLHRNLGDGRFEELSLFLGVDDPRGGMGLAAGDVDRDGDEDVLLTNWQLEANALYRCNRIHGASQRQFMPLFEDVAVQAGLAAPSVGYVGWGCLLEDLDNDGDLDAFVVNGYTSPDYETTMFCVGPADHLFENVSGPGPFAEHRHAPRWSLVSPDSAREWARRALPGRGLAWGDTDGDGDLDLLVTHNNGPLVFLRNERGGRSLRVVPEGKLLRDATGARVTVRLDDGGTQQAFVRNGQGYLGHPERGVRFGLGAVRALQVTVRWPDGTTSTHDSPAQGLLRVTQP